MIQAVVAVAVIVLIFYMWGRGSKPKAPPESMEDLARKHREEYEAGRAKLKAAHLAVWLPIMERLPVVDRETTPRLHSPLYDCVSDEYELPCAHASYRLEYQRVHSGMPFGPVSKDELRETLSNFSDRTDNVVAFVDAGDCAYLLYTETIKEPGSKVQQYVRTGPDTYYAYGLRSGMRPSAGKDDPPYFVRDIAAKPELWVRRMQALREQWPQNSNYAYAQRQCEHR
jgi:hypothetical protein